MLDWFAYGNPNIPAKTLGGYVFWKNVLVLDDDTRVQQNEVDNHYRVLDAQDRRIAWGNESAMRNFIRDKLGVRKELETGDVLAVDRMGWSDNRKGLFQHFAVYIGAGEVVHFAPEGGDWDLSLNNVHVHRTSLGKYLEDADKCYVMVFADADHRPFQVAAALDDKRAPGHVTEWMPNVRLEENHGSLSRPDAVTHLYSNAATVARAIQCIGSQQERKYNLLNNNCEHFAMWCKTGKRQSWQAKDKMADEAGWIFDRDRGPIVYA